MTIRTIEIELKELTTTQLIHIVQRQQDEISRLRGLTGDDLLRQLDDLKKCHHAQGGKIEELCDLLLAFGLDTHDWVNSVRKVLYKHLERKV